jgi:hypothetical protein
MSEQILSITIPYDLAVLKITKKYFEDLIDHQKFKILDTSESNVTECKTPEPLNNQELNISETKHPILNNQETDDFGVIWNSEFHTSNKAKKANGGWKIKPRADKDAYSTYCAQFTQVPDAPMPGVPMPGVSVPDVPMPGVPVPSVPMPGIPVPGVPMPGTPVPSVPVPGVPMPGVPVPGVPMPGVPVPSAPVPGVPMPGAPVPSVIPKNFAELMHCLIAKKTVGLVTEEDINNVLIKHDLTQLSDLNIRTDIIPFVWQDLEKIWN